VVEPALAFRDLLTKEGFDCSPKLTGGAGLHLMAPIEPNLTHRQVHDYAPALADRIASCNPAKYTTLAGSSRRIGKLFIDHFPQRARVFRHRHIFAARATWSSDRLSHDMEANRIRRMGSWSLYIKQSK
jgi:DNA primase